jgi:osmoprotectant transport system substrate-binding protein
MKIRRTLGVLLAAAALITVSACGDNTTASSSGGGTPPSSSGGGSGGGPVTIASQNFPEAALVAEMYKELLTNAGYTPTVKLVSTRDAYMATFPGSVDVVPEYVGGIVNFLQEAKNGANAKEFTSGDGQTLAQQGKPLLDAKGITLLNVSSATDTNAFMVTKQYSQQNGVTKLSDLKGKSVVLAAAPDCEGRLDCAGGLEKDYGINISKILPLGYASAQTYQSVIKGESQLGETSTTDGTLDSQGLVVLQDDKHIQPAQNLVPAVSTKFLSAHPDLAGVLNPLMSALTTDNLTTLNQQISVDRQKPEDVAHNFLTQQGLL